MDSGDYRVIDNETGEAHDLTRTLNGEWLPTPEVARGVAARIAAARETARSPRELKDTRDGARLWEELWQKRGGRLADGNAIVAERLRTEQELGRILLPGNGLNLAGRRGVTVDGVPPVRLADLGLDDHQSSAFQHLAELGDRLDEWIEKRIEDEGELSTAGALAALYQSPAHVAHNSGNNEWYTPPEYIQAARRVMGEIDLDPASSDAANQIVGASTYYTAEDDGLAHDWAGRVWMNPPYAADLIGLFTEKIGRHFAEGSVTEALVLINNATETNWFQDLLAYASAVCFPRQRIRFIDRAGNPSGAPLQGQVVLYLGQRPALFSQEFGSFGSVLYGQPAGDDQE